MSGRPTTKLDIIYIGMRVKSLFLVLKLWFFAPFRFFNYTAHYSYRNYDYSCAF